MASVVLGMGLSHGPTVILAPEVWAERSTAEQASVERNLNTIDGRYLSYAELYREVGPRYASQSNLENFRQQHAQLQRALDRLAAELLRARPDVLVVIGSDQDELYTTDNVPAIAVYHGAEVRTFKRPTAGLVWWRQLVTAAYGLDEVHTYPGSQEIALELTAGLTDRGFDVAASDSVPEPLRRGFGHAWGFVAERVMPSPRIPMVPILINTFRAPNVPSPARCYALGEALREIIVGSPRDLRVGIVASGGLSHMICERELDETVIAALRTRDRKTLCGLPAVALQSGSSEIRAWIALSAAVDHLTMKWLEYVPVYRSPAGAGFGAGFAMWE